MVDGPILYTNVDGKLFIPGEMFEVQDGRIVNLVEKIRITARRELFSGVDEKTLIRFAPESEASGFIYVFTDVNCRFCRKFHNELIAIARKKGIEVKYFAYPVIDGELSQEQMISAWCSQDPQMALSQLKQGEKIQKTDSARCNTHSIEQHLALDNQLELSGTPAVFCLTKSELT